MYNFLKEKTERMLIGLVLIWIEQYNETKVKELKNQIEVEVENDFWMK